MTNARHARQIAIVQQLQSREWTSSASLATRFAVTSRTIYRDIDDLARAGVPIESVPGPDGGYRLAADRPLTPLTIDADDALKLYLVSLLNRAQYSEDDIPIPSTAYSREALRRLSQRIYFDTSDWYWKDEGSGHLPLVREALLTGTALTIVMREKRSSSPSTHLVKPYGIVWKSGEWHLVAAPIDHPPSRFRLNVIDRVSPQRDLRFVYPVDFNLSAWWAGEMEAYGKGDIGVVICVDKTARHELGRLTLKSNSEVLVHEDGGMTLTLFVDRWEWLVPLLASYGEVVRVQHPEALRGAVLDHLRRAVASYEDVAATDASGRANYRNDDSRLRTTRGRSLPGEMQ